MPTLLALAVLTGLWLAGEASGYSPALATTALSVLAVYALMVLTIDPLSFFLSFSITIALAPMVMSNTYIEFGNYISEQGVFGAATGATVRIAWYCVLYMGSTLFFARALIDRTRLVVPSEDVKARFVRSAIRLHSMVLIGALAVLGVYGIPLLRGQDRFAYWAGLPEALNRLPYLIAIMCFLTVCAVVVSPRGKRTAPYLLIVASAMILILFSEKFTGLFAIFTLGVTAAGVTMIHHQRMRPRISRLIFLSLGTAVGLFVVLAVGYMLMYGYRLDTVLDKIIDRAFGLQGHVWYGVDRNLTSGQPGGDVGAIFPAPGSRGMSGMELLMYEISPADFVDRMRALGLRFTMAGQALPVFAFGYFWAAFYQMVAGLISGVVLAYLFLSVSKLRLLSTIVALLALRQVSNAFLTGEPTDLYKPLALLIWTWMVLDLLPRASGFSIRTSQTSPWSPMKPRAGQ